MTFFSDLLKNEDAPLDLRFQAAKELAPYGHPKLTSIEARSGGMGHEEWLEKSTWLVTDTSQPRPWQPYNKGQFLNLSPSLRQVQAATLAVHYPRCTLFVAIVLLLST